MIKSPRIALENGAGILQPFLSQSGFTFLFIEEIKGSGGVFARGGFKKENRLLELGFRWSLSLVRYHIGQVNVSHQSYMAALGVEEQCRYPGFSDDPMDGFRDVLHDLELSSDDFLVGNGAILAQAAESEAKAKEQQEIMANYREDERIRAEARELFHKQLYEQVVGKLMALKYPERLTNSEQRMLEIAHKRIRQ